MLLVGLSTRDKNTNDLLTNLFKGYKAASYSYLVTYIEGKQKTYGDRKDLTPISLMLLAYNKFKTLKLKGEWKKRSWPYKWRSRTSIEGLSGGIIT